jgi:hypothetical protein
MFQHSGSKETDLRTTKNSKCDPVYSASTPKPATPKPPKKARLEVMLNRPRGATQKQLEKCLGWQPHSVRAAISRLRRGGADVVLDRSGRTSTYRIDAAA